MGIWGLIYNMGIMIGGGYMHLILWTLLHIKENTKSITLGPHSGGEQGNFYGMAMGVHWDHFKHRGRHGKLNNIYRFISTFLITFICSLVHIIWENRFSGNTGGGGGGDVSWQLMTQIFESLSRDKPPTSTSLLS